MRIIPAAMGVILLAGAGAFGQPFCLPDANLDGHPRYGHTSVRIAPESFDGWEVQAGQFASTTAAFGDLDGDGDADAVVGDVHATHALLGTRGFISILWGDGDGVFRPGPLLEVGDGPCFVEVADVSGDGANDILICEEHDDAISILTNLGDGTFAPRAMYAAGDSPRSLAVRDFDGDGDLDLLVLNTLSKDVSFLRNIGDGTFEPQVRFAVSGVTQRGIAGVAQTIPGPFLAAADLDHDGDIDAAIPCGSKIRLLLNDGDGGFAVSPTTIGTAIPNAYALAIADLDGNGWEDVASSSYHGVGPECLFTYLATGPLQFAPEVAHDASWSDSPTAIQNACALDAGDADGDGDLDLIVGHYFGHDIVLLRNEGAGSFAFREHIAARQWTWFVKFARSGPGPIADIASITRLGRSTLNVLIRTPRGEEVNYRRYPYEEGPFGPGLESLTAGDLDNDGDADLVTTCWSGKNDTLVRIFVNDGNGAFDTVRDYSVGPPKFAGGADAAIGDLDGDGWPDLVIADRITSGGFNIPGKLWVMRNLGVGFFEIWQMLPLDADFPVSVRLGDLDGDGDLDAVAWTCEIHPGDDQTPVARSLHIFKNDGSGGFSFSAAYPLASLPWFPKGQCIVVDANSDGVLDIVATTTSGSAVDGELHMLYGLGDGSFHDHRSLPLWKLPEGIGIISDSPPRVAVIHDRNFPNDFINPLVVIASLDPDLTINRLIYDDRAMTTGSLASATSSKGAFIAATAVVEGLTLQARLDAEGHGPPFAGFIAGNGPTPVALADFNNDGEIDLAVTTSADSLNIHLARSCPACIPDCEEDGDLDVMDYLCFLDRFADRDPRADMEHDGDWDLFDLLAFQGLFAHGCD